ncbi:MAG: hypothetical protein WBO88_00280, partial [Candidatus Dechloromonas phosphoritropha]
LQDVVLPAGSSGSSRSFAYKNDKVRPLCESDAYLQTIVLGNNGVPINRIVIAENAERAVEQVCFARPKEWFAALPADQPRKLAVYVHGGLNNEEDSLGRIRIMAPYFQENGIYPLFITWKTGALESIGGILEDSLPDIFKSLPSQRDAGIVDKLAEALGEARDRTIEAASEKILVRPLWSQMKQNAAAAAQSGAGLSMLATHLLALKKQFPNLEIHLAGHSAGSIVLGYLFGLFDKKLTAASLSLFAPACTLDFAVRQYGAAISDGKLKPDTVHVDIMNDERELADSVGPYGKSLLYLVSRALESRRKAPMLGMEWSWKTQGMPQDQWSADEDSRKALESWPVLATNMSLRLHDKKREYVSTGAGKIKLAHGSFDNDIDVVAQMLERMRGGPLLAKVENLAY